MSGEDTAGMPVKSGLFCMLKPNAARPGIAARRGSTSDASAIFTEVAPLRTFLATAGDPVRRAIGAGAKAAALAVDAPTKEETRVWNLCVS